MKFDRSSVEAETSSVLREMRVMKCLFSCRVGVSK